MPRAEDRFGYHFFILRISPWRIATVALCVALTAQSALSQATDIRDTQSQGSKISTLRADVRRVSVDVVVTDAMGHPTMGLRQEDFQVAEDNVPQAVRSFDPHTVAPVRHLADSEPLSLPPNTFLNAPSEVEGGAPTVLLYDGVNTVESEQNYARQALLQFVKHRRPGTPVAIFALGSKLYMLQGFTEDTDLLTAALKSTKARRQAMGLQATSLGGYIEPTPGGLDGDPIFDQMLAKFKILAEGDQRARAGDRRIEAAGALGDLGRFLLSVPGRKSLVWLSSTFPMNQQTSNLFRLSRTAIYPVDIKGVKASSVFDATTNAAFGPNGTKFGGATRQFAVPEGANRAWMDGLAESSGGHAFYGTNDLAGAVDQAIADGSTYYSLTYEPTNPKYDGSLRHIKVTLKKPGYNLSYRKTYYADDLNAVAHANADAPESPLSPALERGTPLAHGLFVEAHLDAAGPPIPATPEQRKVLSQFEAMRDRDAQPQKKTSAPAPPVMMQQYTISYALVARQLELPANEAGVRVASLEFGVIAYDENGRKLNGLDTHVDDPLPPERYAKIAAGGYRVAQTVAVPATATCLRLAVRDVKGNRVGSLEVKLPLAKVGEAETK